MKNYLCTALAVCSKGRLFLSLQ